MDPGEEGQLSAAVRHEYCTLFDLNYLPRGLVLQQSLAESVQDFRLHVLCMDDETKAMLDRLALPGVVTIGLAELEAHDPGLARVRGTRSHIEYCWTAPASLCLYLLAREPTLPLITYLDADLMFFADPTPVFEELNGDSILLVPHRFTDRWRWLEKRSGVYNVQLISFRRDDRGLRALCWWRERCLEWCYRRVEKGKYGDQKYLDDWPERFTGVHVLEHAGGGLAPWNSGRYELDRQNGTPAIGSHPILFYHYHGLRLYRAPASRFIDRLSRAEPVGARDLALRWVSDFPLSGPERRLLWKPYVDRLGRAIEFARPIEPKVLAGIEGLGASILLRRLALRAPRPLARLAAYASWRAAGVSRVRPPA